MYWWDRAAEVLTAKGSSLRRFGFVTTKSIAQEYSRRVVAKRMDSKNPISLAMAIPNHPWTKATPDAAQVRIAMTVGVLGEHEGTLNEVIQESGLDTDEPIIEFQVRVGKINSDLSIGVNVIDVRHLLANEGICHDGVKLHGRGFIVTPTEAQHLGLGKRSQLEKYIRPYRNGRDLAQTPRGLMVIDLFGLEADQVRDTYPEVYQHVLNTVKPERDRNNRESYRINWWMFGEPRRELRPAISRIRRYIATVDTARHRIFQYLPVDFICDDKAVIVAADDAWLLGILQSSLHKTWALRAGGWLGVGNDPVYVKTKVFDPFPFPSPGELLKAQIRNVAEELDVFRKQRQKEHPSLTLTQMYNVLEKLKAIEAAQQPRVPSPLAGEGAERAHASEAGEGAPLTGALRASPSPGFAPDGAQPPSPARGEGNGASGATVPELTEDDQRIKDEGLILILKELHEKLDRLVFQAYGWPQTLRDEDILSRLVALNHERAAEERRGHVRWLRPDYQIPRFGKDIDKMAAKEEGAQVVADLGLPEPGAPKPSFPADAVGQTAAVFSALAGARGAVTVADVAANFRRSKNLEKNITAVLDSLARLGHVNTRDGKSFEIRRVA